MSHALRDLVDACRALPGESDRQALVRPRPEVQPATGAPAPRRETSAFLLDLSARLEKQLVAALERAEKAWDQVDATAVLDNRTRQSAAALTQAWRACGGAEAALAVLTLDSSLALVTLLERRLATLVRLRARSATPDLLVGGRPFLDVPRALAETARRWAS